MTTDIYRPRAISHCFRLEHELFYKKGTKHPYCDDCRKIRQRVRRVGITIEDYLRMFEDQQGLCKLCTTGPATEIDHCHATKQVRGLLCRHCNLLLGFLEKVNPIVIHNIEGYLSGNLSR